MMNKQTELANRLREVLLDGKFKEEYGSYALNIEAQIEHSYYHLGQISLIKKILSKIN